MKYPVLDTCILILLAAFAAPIVAQGITAEGEGQDGVASQGMTYNGTGTVQDSHADGDIKVIDVLESDAKVKAEKEKSDKERGSNKAK